MHEELMDQEIGLIKKDLYLFEIGICAYGYFLITQCLENLCKKYGVEIRCRKEMESYNKALSFFVSDDDYFPSDREFKEKFKEDFNRIKEERQKIFHGRWALSTDGYAVFHERSQQKKTYADFHERSQQKKTYAKRNFENFHFLEELNKNIIKWYECYSKMFRFDLTLGRELDDLYYFENIFENVGLFVINFSKIEALINLRYIRHTGNQPAGEKIEALLNVFLNSNSPNEAKMLKVFQKLKKMRDDIAHRFYVDNIRTEDVLNCIDDSQKLIEFLTHKPGHEIEWVFFDDFDKKGFEETGVNLKDLIYLPLTNPSIAILMFKPLSHSKL